MYTPVHKSELISILKDGHIVEFGSNTLFLKLGDGLLDHHGTFRYHLSSLPDEDVVSICAVRSGISGPV